MSIPNGPTIISPNGGETFVSSQIMISWNNPTVVSTDGRAVWFDLYYTDNFKSYVDPNWIQIATLPDTSSSFRWNVGKNIKSSNVRVAICARNSIGERSQFSVSAFNFSVNGFSLPLPAVITPSLGGKYNSQIKIVTDTTNVNVKYPQQASYQFYYSSVKANLPITPIADLALSEDYYLWNTSILPASDDYILYVDGIDPDGLPVQIPVVNQFSISHDGYFFIDTVPPQSAIKILANSPFTNQSDVTVKIYAQDATTAPQSLLLGCDGTKGLGESVTQIKTVPLTEGDGIKTVTVEVQDFGANRDVSIRHEFEDLLSFETNATVDFAIDVDGTVWAVLSGSTNSLYSLSPYPSQVATMTETPTSVGILEGVVYIGTKTSDNKGRISNFVNNSVVSLLTLSDNDSYATSMQPYNRLLYIGTSNGVLYSYDGATLLPIKKFDSPISELSSDNSLLYIYFDNGTKFVAYGETGFISLETEIENVGLPTCPSDISECCYTYSVVLTGTTAVNGTYAFFRSGSRWMCLSSNLIGNLSCENGTWQINMSFLMQSCNLIFSAPADNLVNDCPPLEGWEAETSSACGGNASITVTTSDCLWESSSSSSSSGS